jgi:hypothetical protein
MLAHKRFTQEATEKAYVASQQCIVNSRGLWHPVTLPVLHTSGTVLKRCRH